MNSDLEKARKYVIDCFEWRVDKGYKISSNIYNVAKFLVEKLDQENLSIFNNDKRIQNLMNWAEQNHE